jgi:hypothetical protein
VTISLEKLRAVHETVAVGPPESRGILRATGKDAKDYLHRMSTQDVNRLAPGESTYAAFLTAKGHLLGEGHVLLEDDGALLVEVDPRALPETRALLEKLVIMDEVVFEDLSDGLRAVPVLGPGAAQLLEGKAPRAPRVTNVRRGAPSIDVFLPPHDAEALSAELVASGATPLSGDDLEAVRILAGLPRFGADMDAARLPMEAGLTRAAISFNKGCYIGQEVVLRATARGHLQRGLVQLLLPPGAGPGTKLLADGLEVGVVTSVAETPEGRIALGYLRRALWKAGAQVDANGVPATVRRVLVEEPDV